MQNSAAEAVTPRVGQQVNPGTEQSPFACSGEGEGRVPETGPGWWLLEAEILVLVTHIHD